MMVWLKKGLLNITVRPLIYMAKGLEFVVALAWSWVLFFGWVGCGIGFVVNLICWIAKTQTFAHFCLLTLLLGIVLAVLSLLTHLFSLLGDCVEAWDDRAFDCTIRLDHQILKIQWEKKNARIASRDQRREEKEKAKADRKQKSIERYNDRVSRRARR